MDSILDSLNSFNVTGQPNNTHAEHPRFSQFKSKKSRSNQEQRRRAVLAARQSARYDVLQLARNVIENKSDGEVEEDTSQDMEISEEVKECYKKPRYFKDFVMLSEWLVDVPEDFAENYIAVPVPVGKRSLVVSGGNRTRLYARNGRCLEEFSSVLPGGSRLTAGRGFAILDVIVNYEDDTVYCVDLVAWCNQPLLQCDTNFRFEWLRSRYTEHEYDLGTVTEDNHFRFALLPPNPCTAPALGTMLNTLSFGVALDGILFYHRESHYTHGQTPLVNWLKAYMLPEILGIPVPEKFLEERPARYTTLPQHIEYGKQAREERHARDQETQKACRAARKEKKAKAKEAKKKSAMDCEESSVEDKKAETDELENTEQGMSEEEADEDVIGDDWN